MSRIAVIASLALVAPQITGTAPLRNILPGDQELVAETFPSTPVTHPVARTILWRPAPDNDSQFGLIPTEFQTTPELLPLSWDARVVFAGESGTAASQSPGIHPVPGGTTIRQSRR